MVTLNNTALHEAWKTWSSFQPFAMTSIQLNHNVPLTGSSDTRRQQNISLARRLAGEIFLSFDRSYFNTQHVAERVAKRDRFSGIGVVEKVAINPHLHIAFTIDSLLDMASDEIADAELIWRAEQALDQLGKPELASLVQLVAKGNAKLAARFEQKLKLCFLLEQGNSPGVEIEDHDREFLKQYAPLRRGIIQPPAINWEAKGWTAKTTSIHDAEGLRSYIFKEQLYEHNFSDQLFTIDTLHSSRQRIKPTRYCRIDRVTQARQLNLDEPLRPRR